MNMDIHSATPPVEKNAENTAKNSNSVLFNACKNPDVSIASVALQHSINANLSVKWIQDLQPCIGCQGNDPHYYE